MATKSPLAQVKDEFGGKDKLVDKIVGLLDGGDEPKDDLRRRLLGAANGKLIRLHRIATEVKQIGGKEKLAATAAGELGRSKDKDYVAKLETYSSGRLLDLLGSAKRRARRAEAAKSSKAAPKGAGKGGAAGRARSKSASSKSA